MGSDPEPAGDDGAREVHQRHGDRLTVTVAFPFSNVSLRNREDPRVAALAALVERLAGAVAPAVDGDARTQLEEIAREARAIAGDGD